MAPEITTSRLILRTMTPADSGALIDYRSLPEVARYHSWHPGKEADALDFILKYSYRREPEMGNWLQFGIYLKGDNLLIGDTGFNWITDELAEIGFTIAPSYQRRGFAREVVAALCEFLFENIGVRQIAGVTVNDNAPSMNLLLGLGFRQYDEASAAVELRSEPDDRVFIIQQTG